MVSRHLPKMTLICLLVAEKNRLFGQTTDACAMLLALLMQSSRVKYLEIRFGLNSRRLFHAISSADTDQQG